MSNIYLSGVNGVGKTTIAEKFVLLYPEYHCADGSLILKTYVANQGHSVKTLEKLPKAVIADARENALLTYLKNNENVILTGHGFLTKNDVMLIDYLFFINASIKRILNHRINDITRELKEPRIKQTPEEIMIDNKNHYSRLMASTVNNKPIYEIQNEGSLEDICKKIYNIIE